VRCLATSGIGIPIAVIIIIGITITIAIITNRIERPKRPAKSGPLFWCS
jgi:hypothetical protein